MLTQFTLSDLLQSAEAMGYAITRNQFDLWKHRGLMTAPCVMVSPPGERRRLGIWNANDASRFHALCFFNHQNSRREAVQAGLWLLGYQPTAKAKRSGEAIARDWFIQQLERLEHRLYGRHVGVDDVLFSDDAEGETERDQLAIRWNEALAQKRIVQVISQGARATIANGGWHDDDSMDIQAFDMVSIVLGVLLSSQDVQPDVASEVKRKHVFDSAAFPLTLPQAITILERATDATLELARTVILSLFSNAVQQLGTWESMPSMPSINLSRLLAPYHFQMGYLIASPRLAPFVAWITAVICHRDEHRDYTVHLNPRPLLYVLEALALTDTEIVAPDVALAILFTIMSEPLHP